MSQRPPVLHPSMIDPALAWDSGIACRCGGQFRVRPIGWSNHFPLRMMHRFICLKCRVSGVWPPSRSVGSLYG